MLSPNGTETSVKVAPDPRFGVMATFERERTTTLPSGLTRTESTSLSPTLATAGDPLSMTALARVHTVNGKSWTSTWDATTRTWTSTSPLGRTSTSTLDPFGDIASSSVPGVLPVSMTRDAFGRLTATTQGARASAYTYDPLSGFVASATNPLAQTTSFTRDAVGRVLSQTLPDGSVIGLTWDAHGNLASVTPPGKPTHTMGYSSVDLMTSYNPPVVAGSGTTSTAYTYDADRALTSTTRPDGQVVSYAHDAAGRLGSITTPSGTYTYTYHPTSGQVTRIDGPGTQSVAFSYDGSLRTSESWSGSVNGSVSWTYDADFRVSEEKVNGGHSAAFGYDDDGLLTSVGPMSLTRNPANGRVTDRAVGALTEHVTYNANGEPAGYAVAGPGGALYDVAYVRDDLGRIAQKTETRGGVPHTYVYSYDAQGRLTDVLKDPGPGEQLAHYDYDANGNRTAASVPWLPAADVATGQAVYDGQDRLMQYGATTFTYTANGEVASKVDGSGVTTYLYDTEGNLLSVTLPNGDEVSYVVDGRNRRIARAVNGVITQQWLYGDQLRIVAELDAVGTVVSRFIYEGSSHSPDLMVRGGVTYRLVKDQVGSVLAVVDVASEAVVQAREYDAWGAVLSDTAPGWQPFGFAGGLWDAATGLVRFGRRDYSPQQGGWVSGDRQRYAGGSANLRGYALGDPLNRIDENGELPRFVSDECMFEFAAAVGCTGKVAIDAFKKDPTGFLNGFICAGTWAVWHRCEKRERARLLELECIESGRTRLKRDASGRVVDCASPAAPVEPAEPPTPPEPPLQSEPEEPVCR